MNDGLIPSDARLICEVKKHPNLYDTTLIAYRDNSLREKTWTDIGLRLDSPPEECLRRWRLLRDRYVREKKRLLASTSDSPSTIATGDRDTKRLFAEMDFVGHYIKHRHRKRTKILHTVSPATEPDQDTEDPETPQTFRSFENLSDPPQMHLPIAAATEYVLVPATSLSGPADPGHNPLPESSSRVPTNGPRPYRLEATPKKCERESAPDSEGLDGDPVREEVVRSSSSSNKTSFDEEEHFALSVAATLKRLPQRTKALAKLNIQKILYEIEFQNMDH